MTHPRYRLAILASHPIQYQAPLFRSLAAQPDMTVQVFLASRAGADVYRDKEFGVEVCWDTPILEGYPYTVLPNLSRSAGPGHFTGLVNPAVTRFSKREFDAVWIHGWAYATNWLAWGSAAVRGLPLLLRGETNGLREPVGWRRTVKHAVLGAMFSKIARFLAIGSLNENFYKSYGVRGDRIFLSPYTVDNEYFFERARSLEGQQRELRQREGIAPDLPVVLYCAKLIPKKRPFDLLRAFAIVMKKIRASLVFVGDGHLRPELEQFADKNALDVHFLGFRNQSELPKCYAMSDVLVLPSDYEPWGLVVNEAMCFGLPIIASDKVGAAADLIRDGLNGFVYPVGNIPAVAEALIRVLGNDVLRREMGASSAAIIRTWSISETVEGVRNALASLRSNRTSVGR
jgi:glycosyltransferase involved in cell wall biosynthesis